MTGRIEEATPQLPAHERQRGASIPEVQGPGTWSWCVGGPQEVQPALGIVPDPGDALRGDRRSRDTVRRSAGRVDGAALTHAVSMAAEHRSGSDRVVPVRGCVGVCDD